MRKNEFETFVKRGSPLLEGGEAVLDIRDRRTFKPGRVRARLRRLSGPGEALKKGEAVLFIGFSDSTGVEKEKWAMRVLERLTEDSDAGPPDSGILGGNGSAGNLLRSLIKRGADACVTPTRPKDSL